jgi:hypothetical protein
MDANTPSELTGPLPRRVCATRQGFWIATGASIVLACALAVGLWLGYDAAQQWQNWEALNRNGSEVVGNVTKMEMGKSPRVYYAFTVNGTFFTGKAWAPREVLQSLRDSGALPIRYVPANPSVNHPVGWESAPLDSVWFLLPLPLVLAGIALLISMRMERQLVVDGAPAAGVITKCSYGSRGGYTARYEFRAEDGRVMTKRVGVPGPLKVGSNIWVLYLRQNPRRSQLYPSSNYRVAE